MKEFTVEVTNAGRRYDYHYSEPCKDGGALVVILTRSNDCGGRHSMAARWKKAGHIDRILKSWWSVDVCAYDEAGGCWGRYNPQEKGGKIDFDWMLEDTEPNRAAILAEIERRAF